MNTINQNLIDALSNKPEFLRSKDLIELGLFKTLPDVCWSKKRGFAPPFIKIGKRKYVYPKKMLIEWLNALQNSSSIEANTC